MHGVPLWQQMNPDKKRILIVDDDLDAALAEADRIRAQLSTRLATPRPLSTLTVGADTRAGDLMQRIDTVRSLIESRDTWAAMESLQDILVHLIGAEEFTIYSIDRREQILIAIAGRNMHRRTSDYVPVHKSWLGSVVRSAAVFVARSESMPSDPRVPDVAAVVPLRVLDRVVGAIVIVRLLPHLSALDACDREILGLLGVYAATAIIAADRRGPWRELPDSMR